MFLHHYCQVYNPVRNIVSCRSFDDFTIILLLCHSAFHWWCISSINALMVALYTLVELQQYEVAFCLHLSKGEHWRALGLGEESSFRHRIWAFLPGRV